MNTLVVTPSVRSFPPEFFEPIHGKATHLVIDDSKGTVDRSEYKERDGVIIADAAFVNGYIFDRQLRQLIPSGSPSCKNFGLLYAYREGYDVVCLIDDDCDMRVTPDYLDQVPIGKTVKATRFSTASGWYNPMTQLTDLEIYARGYPYEYRGESLINDVGTNSVSPYLNEGLWVGVPDINGIDKLAMQRLRKEGDPESPWIVPDDTQVYPDLIQIRPGQHLPLSIQNVQLHRDIIPAFWQPPDYCLYSNFRVRRHDDVWSMYFAKKIMDYKDLTATAGKPIVKHTKAGDLNGEILSEHTTNLIQYWMCWLVDTAYGQVLYQFPGYDTKTAAQILADCMLSVMAARNPIPGNFDTILEQWALGCLNWSRLV